MIVQSIKIGFMIAVAKTTYDICIGAFGGISVRTLAKIGNKLEEITASMEAEDEEDEDIEVKVEE